MIVQRQREDLPDRTRAADVLGQARVEHARLDEPCGIPFEILGGQMPHVGGTA
ncbi:MAG TPA: hypothetical protein VKE51_09790 [Vicinamibacterales bacterium]|nr:hypothetical protein [Vicinamibacterales bacterium]